MLELAITTRCEGTACLLLRLLKERLESGDGLQQHCAQILLAACTAKQVKVLEQWATWV